MLFDHAKFRITGGDHSRTWFQVRDVSHRSTPALLNCLYADLFANRLQKTGSLLEGEAHALQTTVSCSQVLLIRWVPCVVLL